MKCSRVFRPAASAPPQAKRMIPMRDDRNRVRFFMVVLLDNGIAYSSSWSGENMIGEINYNGNELHVEKI